jgi:ribose/xylose/arabinose/galactoside ABC-type transport system permease subunit
MKAPQYSYEIGQRVLLFGLLGLGIGFVFATGVLDLLPSRTGRRRPTSYFEGMTVDHYLSNFVWFSIVGLLAGAILGVILGFVAARDRASRYADEQSGLAQSAEEDVPKSATDREG